MGEIITVASGKGGVGKTTTTANLSCALTLMGKKVLAIDGDIGLRNLDIALGVSDKIVYNFFDVIKQRCSLDKAIIKCDCAKGLSMLSAPCAVDEKLTEVEICDFISSLKPYYDYILIDCKAGIDDDFISFAKVSDRTLVVSNPDLMSLRDAERVVSSLENLGKFNNFLIINKIILDMMKKSGIIDVDKIINVVAVPLIGVIPEDMLVINSNNNGVPVVRTAKSRVGQAYYNIARRINGEKVAILPDEKVSLFKKIFGGRS